mmetsp:Transcript_8447/g.18416  ORF Transcript_8447/g.18416 Transcript_8447/m.18416 type:complete len:367 (-) Transcript_8447:60-1160(-)
MVVSGGTLEGDGLVTAALVVPLGVLYLCTSSGLISLNKYLMHEDRFPFAVPLVLIHMFFCSALTSALYFLKPSFFPSLTDSGRTLQVDRSLILRGALPIALFFSGTLVLSNLAYLHSSVAFLQMLKEANLVLVYVLSLVAALETFSMHRACVIVLVLFATTLTVHGELNFSLTGFVIQGSSQILESAKIVLQGLLLCSAGRKIDVLTYVLLVTPLCFAILSVVLVVASVLLPGQHFNLPGWHHFQHWWPYLILNALLAFLLNVTIALFMKYSSPVAFILAGVMKDAVIVLAGNLLFHESVTSIQAIGFSMQLVFVTTWSMMKAFPDVFEGGVMKGLMVLNDGFVGGKPPTVKGYGAVAAREDEAQA